MKNSNTIKYFAYVRKSTEGEERQALSISSQMDKVKEFFGSLDIVEVLEEKHSAFKPYNRPVFEDMIKRIRKGEASGIIAWHPDRLSRNEIDASTITYLVRTGIITDLKFGSYNFDNSPEGIMMLQMSLSQSQYFSSKLGKDVRRGLEKKFEMGWQPNMCPNGYVNIRDNKTGISTIEVDMNRFVLLRKAFDLMLTGNYSVPEVLEKLNSWGFQPKYGKSELSRSSLYRIFTNIFYAGIIEYGGKQKTGKHKAMMTLEEYDRIQFLLGRKGEPRRRTNDFAYTGIIRCAVCGCLICADKKTKIVKSTNEEREYIYYCCTHKKKGVNCREKSIEVKTLEEQIDTELSKYELQKDFRDFFFKVVEETIKNKPQTENIVIKNLKNKIEKLKLEKSNLTRLSCKCLITDEEFIKQKNDYEKEIIISENDLKKVKANESKGSDIFGKIDFIARAREKFKKNDNKKKNTILKELGSNHEIKSRKLLITPYKWLIPIKEEVKPLEARFYRFELNKYPLDKAKKRGLNLASLRTAVGVGFEPTEPVKIQQFSRLSYSTALAPHRFENK